MTPRQYKSLLYLLSVLSDCAGFVVVFLVSRELAEAKAPAWYLGVCGAGFSLFAGCSSLLTGWVSHRFDSRFVVPGAALLLLLGVSATAGVGTDSPAFLPCYWLMAVGLGGIYPTLVGWLNHSDDSQTSRKGVSRTLILFCISWNSGMMCGQLSAGALFDYGPQWSFGLGIAVATVNLLLAVLAAVLMKRCLPPVSASAQAGSVARTEASETQSVDPELAELAGNFKRLSWIANLGGNFGGSLVFHMLADLAVTINVPPAEHGSLMAYWRCVVIGMYLLLHFASVWHFRFAATALMQMLGIVGLVTISQAQSEVGLVVGLTLLGCLVGYNYFAGLFYSTAGSTQASRALSAGIHEATLAAGMATGTVVGGVLGTMISPRAPYLLAAGVLVVLLAVEVVVCRRWSVPLRGRMKVALADQG